MEEWDQWPLDRTSPLWGLEETEWRELGVSKRGQRTPERGLQTRTGAERALGD